jgi:hypothetical protein
MRNYLLLLAAAAMLAAAPAHAQTCTPFTDVAANDPFCTNIQWMFNRGITLGCTTTTYCPTQFVRRDQMAAFMNRLGNVVHQQGGNAFAGPGVLGTTDDQPLEIRVNGTGAMRFAPSGGATPNVIGGSSANVVVAGARGGTIGGGGTPAGVDPRVTVDAPNTVAGSYGTVSGGALNRAGVDVTDGEFTTVGGGFSNTASGLRSTVGGGAGNAATSANATVAGGTANTASGSSSTVAGGMGNTASASMSIVAGGQSNTAAGTASFAAGTVANANAIGCFVWGDHASFAPVSCDGANRFIVRSRGGVYFWAGGTSQATYFGVELRPNDVGWVQSSDRNLKENLQSVDTREVLERVVRLPITTWTLKAQELPIRHMGVMAQDFRSAFGLGDSELGINTVDADGVALAAIQGLHAKLETKLVEQARQIAEQARAIAEHAREVRSLRSALADVLARLDRSADLPAAP